MVHGDVKLVQKKYEDHTNLKELSLWFENLTSLEVNIFNTHENLTHLSLFFNELTRLDSKIFNSLINLTVLSLSYNNLTSLDVNLFNGLVNLTQLSIDHNRLDRLEANTFQALERLTKLWLNANQLTDLDRNIFKNLTNLECLYLHENKLTHLEKMTFSHFSKIKLITLYSNRRQFLSYSKLPKHLNDDKFSKEIEPFLTKLTTIEEKKEDTNSNSIVKSINKSRPRHCYEGKKIKNFEIIKSIGQGNFADVFLCHDSKDKSQKAIKIYSGHNVGYIEDVNLLFKINCEFIIKYYSYFEYNGSHLIVLEYAQNGDLLQLIENHKSKSEKIDPSRIFKWIMQATQGLRELHSRSIIHRDIKPANILVTREDTVKLADLGTAKILSEYRLNLEKFSIIGSLSYISPEILNTKSYEFKTDVWSLGCVLYELVYLKIAFTPLHRDVNQLKLGNSNLDQLIKKILVVKQEKRPSADELYQHLKSIEKSF